MVSGLGVGKFTVQRNLIPGSYTMHQRDAARALRVLLRVGFEGFVGFWSFCLLLF